MQLPDEMNAELADILGTICFEIIGVARVMRAAGQVIPYKAEAEQAAVIFEMLKLYAEHGAAWRPAYQSWFSGTADRAKAATVAKRAIDG